jgi:hypothetical protein
MSAEPKAEGVGGAVKFHWSAELTDVGGDASRVKHRVHLGSAAVIAASGIAAPVRHQTQPQAVTPRQPLVENVNSPVRVTCLDIQPGLPWRPRCTGGGWGGRGWECCNCCLSPRHMPDSVNFSLQSTKFTSERLMLVRWLLRLLW